MRKYPFLEQIKQEEGGFKIETTKSLLGHRKMNYNKPFRIFKTSIFFKSAGFIFILGIPLFAIYMQINKPTPMTENQQTGMLVTIIVFFILLVNAIRQFVVDKELNYTIKVDIFGILVNDDFYPWSDIYETAILQKSGGKDSYAYLVIAMKNKQTYWTYDLINFHSFNIFGFKMTLSKYIEHFKTKANLPT